MTSATFRKHERLSGRDTIAAVLKNGSAVNEPPLRIMGLLTDLDTTAPAQVAFAIPKRHVKLATTRNRIRRHLREAYRQDKERWYAPLRAQGRQCAWLITFRGAAPIGLAHTRERLARAMDRWLQQHLTA